MISKSSLYKAAGTKFKHCHWPGGNCNSKVIAAHVIQNSRILGQLSESGTVVVCKSDLDDGQPNVRFKRVGRNQATTVFAFCQEHDSKIFAPMEVTEFNAADSQHRFLCAYRLAIREYHKQLEGMHKLRVYSESLGVNSDSGEIHRLKMAVDFIIKNITPIKELIDRFGEIYLKKEWDSLNSEVVNLKGNQTLASGGLVDAAGTPVVFSLLPSQNKPTLIISSLSGFDFEPINKIKRSADDHQLFLVSKLILQWTDLIVMKPSSYEALGGKQVSTILEFFKANLFDQKSDSEDPALSLFHTLGK